jgi:hypothetical protein
MCYLVSRIIILLEDSQQRERKFVLNPNVAAVQLKQVDFQLIVDMNWF